MSSDGENEALPCVSANNSLPCDPAERFSRTRAPTPPFDIVEKTSPILHLQLLVSFLHSLYHSAVEWVGGGEVREDGLSALRRFRTRGRPQSRRHERLVLTRLGSTSLHVTLGRKLVHRARFTSVILDTGLVPSYDFG